MYHCPCEQAGTAVGQGKHSLKLDRIQQVHQVEQLHSSAFYLLVCVGLLLLQRPARGKSEAREATVRGHQDGLAGSIDCLVA